MSITLVFDQILFSSFQWEEISGVAFIFNQKFFLELREETGQVTYCA